MIKNRLLIGGGCLLLAAAIAVIAIYGGEEEEETCLDESPIGFYDEHVKNHPLKGCEIIDIDYKTLKENEAIYTSCKEATIDDETFKAIGEKYLKNHSEVTSEHYNNNLAWRYPMAYAEYYGLNKAYNVKEKNHINYIFDSSINCFAGKNQIYIHQTDGVKYKERATFELSKSLSRAKSFGLFMSSATSTLNVEINFSIIKKVADKKYESHNLIFNRDIAPGNGMTPPYCEINFDSFEGFDSAIISGCNTISVSYKILNEIDHDAENEDFIKLYEILLPNSSWN